MHKLLLLAVFLFHTLLTGDALIHQLNIKKDDRFVFFIESFGFAEGGVMEMSITNWKLNSEPLYSSQIYASEGGFIIRVTDTDSTAFIEEDSSKKISDYVDEIAPITVNTSERTVWNTTVTNMVGFYNLHFANLYSPPTGHGEVTFNLELIQYNVDSNGRRNYLSIGMSELPLTYGLFTIAYVVMVIVWVVFFLRGPNLRINRLHHLMTLLIVLKLLSLLFEAVEKQHLKTTGYTGGWAIAYYIFTGSKTLIFFVLIALIGTGFSFIKPFLSDKDKKIFMVVIPLQVLDNIAMIIVDETAPGSQSWLTWKDIFRLVDIICCGAVLIPIIWSIKHLREASEIDGKAAVNLQKLKLFRQFYLIVVSYIYFTRIIIYLLDATLPYHYVWLGEFFSELAALVFFCVVGYKFRPAEDNPYFKMPTDYELDTRVPIETRTEE